jgi:hypothetical protein
MSEQAATVFTGSVKAMSLKDAEDKQAELFEQIGRLKMELEWVKNRCVLVNGSVGKSSRAMKR